jgi:hypothetical protein
MTFENTKDRRGTDAARKLMIFVGKYISENPDGREISSGLGIEGINGLRTLTPKQAICLSTQITSNLTQYDHQAIKKIGGRGDQMTALELLENGLKLDDQGNIKPAGVCRNYADTCHLIFQTLKFFQQPESSRLNSTYSIIAGGDTDMFDPTLRDKRSGGHAWNIFITQNDAGSAVVQVDPTWGYRKQKDSSQRTALSYTTVRSEFLINLFQQTQLRKLSSDSPVGKAIARYYHDLIRQSTQESSQLRLRLDAAKAAWCQMTPEERTQWDNTIVYDRQGVQLEGKSGQPLTNAQRMRDQVDQVRKAEDRTDYYLVQGAGAMAKCVEGDAVSQDIIAIYAQQYGRLIRDTRYRMSKSQLSGLANFIIALRNKGKLGKDSFDVAMEELGKRARETRSGL